jgi:hypothetical protein
MISLSIVQKDFIKNHRYLKSYLEDDFFRAILSALSGFKRMT